MIKVLVVEEQGFIRERIVEDTSDIQLHIARKNVTLQRDAISELDVELVRESAPDDAGCALFQESLFLFRSNLKIDLNFEEVFRLNSKSCEVVALIGGLILVSSAVPH